MRRLEVPISLLILGIPGPWTGQEDLMRAVVERGGMPPRFLYAGQLLMELATQGSVQVDLYGHNPHLAAIMQRSSNGSIEEAEAQQIAAHKSIAYLLGDTEDPASGALLHRAATFLLDCGGTAVKVESAGMAVGSRRWRNLAARGTTVSRMESFVTLVGGTDDCYSCGMHHLGLPDCAVSTQVPQDHLVAFLTSFNFWQLHGDEPPAEGKLFALGLDGPVVRMTHQPFGYEADNPMNNPFGRWYLAPTTASLDLTPAFSGSGGVMFQVPSDDPKMEEAKRRARATLHHLVQWSQDPDDYGMGAFKAPLQLGGETHHMWLVFDHATDKALIGRLFELPAGVTGVDLDRPITIPRDQVEDWHIRKGGLVIGGFTMQVVRSSLPPETVQHYDLFTVALAYTPAEELLPS